ncbi:hypothetical protein ACERIM_06355 [Natrinema sp. H-ect1]|uniref:hypothetical protein n=1 Tax=Natrinema sp. H-ect1 TaxID=3242700 RepID=UPI00359E92ED
MYDAVDWFIFSCADQTTETTSYDGDPAATQTTLHGMAVSEWESQQALLTILNNYGQDTATLGSLEARNAIATAYQQENSTTTADQMAPEAIRDYYSVREINTLESYTKSQAQYAHIGNLTNEDAIASDFLQQPMADWAPTRVDSVDEVGFTGGLQDKTYTLANGTTHTYQVAEVYVDFTHPNSGPRTVAFAPDPFIIDTNSNGNYGDWDESYTAAHPMDPWELNESESNGNWSPSNTYNSDMLAYFNASSQFNVRNSYAGTSEPNDQGLPGQKVSDLPEWDEALTHWSNESSTLTTEYSDISSDLYNEMDAGRLDPNELRGAEGMWRYLAGGSDGSEGSLRTALHYVLDTSNPNLTETSTMRVHIDGYTDLKWDNSTNSSSREPVPTSPMNGTVEGLLFADGVSSISSGATYSTTVSDNQSFYLIKDDGTQTTLIEGDLTVEAIYDADGNEKNSTSYEDPKYGTYNASEFVQYLDENEEARKAIISKYIEEDDSSGFQIPGIPGFPNGGGAFVGLVIIGGAVVVAVAVVTDLGPGGS